jgi:hypothetical protein
MVRPIKFWVVVAAAVAVLIEMYLNKKAWMVPTAGDPTEPMQLVHRILKYILVVVVDK